jgi:hypothetical protein
MPRCCLPGRVLVATQTLQAAASACSGGSTPSRIVCLSCACKHTARAHVSVAISNPHVEGCAAAGGSAAQLLKQRPAAPPTTTYLGHSANRRCCSCSQRVRASSACRSCHALSRASGPLQPGAKPSGEAAASVSRLVSLQVQGGGRSRSHEGRHWWAGTTTASSSCARARLAGLSKGWHGALAGHPCV